MSLNGDLKLKNEGNETFSPQNTFHIQIPAAMSCQRWPPRGQVSMAADYHESIILSAGVHTTCLRSSCRPFGAREDNTAPQPTSIKTAFLVALLKNTYMPFSLIR